MHTDNQTCSPSNTYECPYGWGSQGDQYKPNKNLLPCPKKQQTVLGYNSAILPFFFLIQWSKVSGSFVPVMGQAQWGTQQNMWPWAWRNLFRPCRQASDPPLMYSHAPQRAHWWSWASPGGMLTLTRREVKEEGALELTGPLGRALVSTVGGQATTVTWEILVEHTSREAPMTLLSVHGSSCLLWPCGSVVFQLGLGSM